MNIVVDMCCHCTKVALLSESEVVFMSFILFLIYALMVSATVNVTLLTILYIKYVNSIIDKE